MEKWRRADPFVVDSLLALLVAVITFATVAVTREPHGGPELSAVGALLLLGQTLPVAWRRERPVLAWIVVGLATAIYGIADYPDTVLDLGPLLVLFTVASLCNRRTATRLGILTMLLIVASLWAAGDADAEDVSYNLLIFALAWVAGEHQRTRRAYTGELEAKAERLEKEREEEARRAASSERARIARELHDVVAHHVSMMVVQAEGGASVLPTSPELAAEAFDAIGTAGRRAMTDMRRILGVLREDVEDRDLLPQPGLEAVDALVERVRQTGLPVRLQREGMPRPLPSGLDVSAYRILQEALTNAVRHAQAHQATVTVRYRPDGLELEVADDGRGPPATFENGGHGLVGMRERVALFGGDLRVGPREGGGFSVVARLPTGA